MESKFSKLDHHDESASAVSEDDESLTTIPKYGETGNDYSDEQLNNVVSKDESEQEKTTSNEDFDDLNAVFCYCQQARNGRFMICCDLCDNWFHGDCVGVSEDMELLAHKSRFVCFSCQDEEHDSFVVEQDNDEVVQDNENEDKYSKELNGESDAEDKEHNPGDYDQHLEDEEAERSKVVRLWKWPNTPTALELTEPQKRWGGLSLQELIVNSRDNLKQLRCRGPRCDKLLYEPADALFCAPDCVERYASSVMAEVRAAKGLPSDTYTHNLNVALQMAYVHFVIKDSKYDLRAYPVARRLSATSQCLADYLTTRLCEQVLMGPVRAELIARRRRLQQKQTPPQLGSLVSSSPLIEESDVRISVGEPSKIEIAPEQRAATALDNLLTEDTTNFHGTGHVFDNLCRICNGQQQQLENSIAKPVKKVYPRPRIEESEPSIVGESEELPAQEKEASKLPLLWSGSLDCCIFDDRYCFQCRAYDVAGTTQYLRQDIGNLLKVHARINKDIVEKHVHDSLIHSRRGGRSEVVIVRLSPCKEPHVIETYLRLFRVLEKHEKCGAVKIEDRPQHIKDMYLYPLSSKAPIPSAFGLSQVDESWTANESNCVGFEACRPHLILLIIIRYRGPPPSNKAYDEKFQQFSYDTDSPPSTGAPSPPLPASISSKCSKSDKKFDTKGEPASKMARVKETDQCYDPAITLLLPSYATGPGIQAAYGTESNAYTLLPPPPPPLPNALNNHVGSAGDAYQADYSDWHDPLPSETYEYHTQPGWQDPCEDSFDFRRNVPRQTISSLSSQSREYVHGLAGHSLYQSDWNFTQGQVKSHGGGYQTSISGSRDWHHRGHKI